MELVKAHNWEEYGSLTVDEAADEASNIFADYYEVRPCMLGAIIAYATTSLPDGTLACDGQTYNKSDYPRLYDSLDSAFIVDATSFRVPDLRGRSVVGTGQGSGLTNRAVDDGGGAETHTLTLAQIASHGHSYAVGVFQPFLAGTVPAFANIGLQGATTGDAGGGGAHNNMHPFRALKYAIVAR
jgi:microcystin-dependent protein